MNASALSLAVCLGFVACIDTGQEAATVALFTRGTEVTQAIAGKNAWTVELGRADVAFGPLYVCAGAQAGRLCDTAQLEWLESVVVDGLDGEPHEVGVLGGVTGFAKSWMCDLGITSLMTQKKPTVLETAQDLGGSSVVLEGVAQKAPHSITFRVQIPIQPGEEGEVGVPMLAKGSSEDFDHDIAPTEDSLTVTFDPRPWAAAINFEDLVRGEDCEADGCTLDLTLDLDSPAGGAVRTAVLSGTRPSFTWGSAP